MKINCDIDDDRFHLVKDNDYRKDVINIVVGVQVTEEMEKACLEGHSVYLVHDLIMLQNISKSYQQNNKENPSDWRETAKWMTWNTHPLKEEQIKKYHTLEDMLQTEEAKAFLAQDYELE